MKQIALICGLILLATAAWPQSEELRDLVPPYWIVGTVTSTPGAAASGRFVDFYKTNADLAAGRYAQGIVSGNNFILNAFQIWPAELNVGETYQVATERRADDFGANSTVTISGLGWDQVFGLNLQAGGGINQPAVDPGGEPVIQEPAPTITPWFGSGTSAASPQRLYQDAIVAAGAPFVISQTPQLKVEISIAEPFAISSALSDYSIVLDPNTSSSRTLALSTANMTVQSYAAADELKSFTIQYEIKNGDKLSDGSHVFLFSARSAGTRGVAAAATRAATVEVMGGPLSLRGNPLTFPAPFSRTTSPTLTIQYILSADADIDLYLYSVEGKIVKKIMAAKGGEGGSAGTNKVTWDTITQAGYQAGAGVYVGSIVAREENRVLGKFKIAIVE